MRQKWRERNKPTWQKQPKCPVTDEMDKLVVYIYKGILLGHKKKERKPFAYGPRDYHIKWS